MDQSITDKATLGYFIRMCYGVMGWVGIEFKELLSIALRN